MIQPGLVSITFRQLAPRQVVDLVRQAGLEAIEWGGDVHVPHGDLAQARHVRKLTAEAGLQVAAYGSYYRVGHQEPVPFEAVLETAVELGAPAIRVWPGKQGSDTADAAYWELVVADSRHIAAVAQTAGVVVAYEFHVNTLTDTNASARKLLELVGHANIKSLWQPPRYSALDDNLAGLQAVLPWLLNVHVFNWHIRTGERLPLREAGSAWMQYLQKVAASGRDHYALIEFVQDDAPERFLQDAQALRDWLACLES